MDQWPPEWYEEYRERPREELVEGLTTIALRRQVDRKVDIARVLRGLVFDDEIKIPENCPPEIQELIGEVTDRFREAQSAVRMGEEKLERLQKEVGIL